MTEPPNPENVVKIETAKKKARSSLTEDGALTLQKTRGIDPNSLAAIQVFKPWRGMEWHSWQSYADDWGMPPCCPVVPLGLDGETYFVIDASGNLQKLRPKDFGRNEIASLFNRHPEYPKWFWPRTRGASKQTAHMADEHNNVPTGEFHAEKVRDAIMLACANKSRNEQWDMDEKLRGTGAWKSDDGQLVFHLGSKVLVGEEAHETGEVDNYYYPKSASIMHPDPSIASPGQRLLTELRGWNTRRGELDAHILLGWIMSALAGGALDNRPGLYLSGPKGTGKSTLIELIKMVMGGMAFHSADTTAAGIRQTVGHKSIPVLIDEAAEAKADNRASKSLFELFRIAYDGSEQNRGSSDHKAVKFRVRSSFLFASINRVGMTGQDRSRMAFISLMPISKDAKEPHWEARELRELGQGLMAAWQAKWPMYHETRGRFYEALREVGHEARSATVFGTLASCSHLALRDHLPESHDLGEWATWLAPETLDELVSTETDSDLAILHMTTKTTRRMEQWKNGLNCVADVIGSWVELSSLNIETYQGDLSLSGVNKHLHQVGMALCPPTPLVFPSSIYDADLFVSSNLPGTEEVFAGTHWGDNGGGQGTWIGALQNIGPQGTSWKPAKARIANRQVRGIRIKLHHLIDFELEKINEPAERDCNGMDGEI